MIENKIIENIKDRLIKLNRNWLCAIVGETGSGKSYSAMRICELLDSSFNISRIVFTPKEFMELLNSDKLKQGNAIIVDEAGIFLPSREFFSFNNRAINFILQSFRHRNLGVIFTLPDLSFCDSQSRQLFHTLIQTLLINPEKQICRVKWFNLHKDFRTQKQYSAYPISFSSEGSRIHLERVNISLPSKALTDAYEVKKTDFTAELNLNLLEDFTTLEINTNVQKQRMGIDLDQIKQDAYNIKESLRNQMGYISDIKIMNKFNVGESRAQRVKDFILDREKGGEGGGG